MRMDVNSFYTLLAKVEPYIKKQDTHLRQSICAEARIEATLRFLASGCSYTALQYSTRISKQSLSLIIPETCQAIYTVLRDDYLKEAMGVRRSRYSGRVLEAVDTLISILTQPFQHLFSLALSCYILTTFDNPSTVHLFFRFALIGPVLAIISAILFPFATVGFVLWVLLNYYCAASIQPFRISTPKHDGKGSQLPRDCPKMFTFLSANVLFCPEFIVRLNNGRNVYWRVTEVARRILNQDPELNLTHNLSRPVHREHVVQCKVPEVDVVILQEVMERFHAHRLISSFSPRYPYIVYDVAVNSFPANCFLMPSGLFLASRYPILDVTFHPFRRVSHYGLLVSLGVLVAKLDLGALKGKDGEELRAVGYVANTHTQAFQGKDKIIVGQLSEVKETLRKFIAETHNPEKEVIVFSVVGGDFNSDNMSPGDQATREHPFYHEYEDPCRECDGQDHQWAVGTEHRQPFLSQPQIRDPVTFKAVLMDDVERRKYILDADIKEHTTAMMHISPRPDQATGRVSATLGGGGRRIDHLNLRRGDETRPVSYWFLSCLASLTDHVPIAMMVERRGEEEQDVEEIGERKRGEERGEEEEEAGEMKKEKGGERKEEGKRKEAGEGKEEESKGDDDEEEEVEESGEGKEVEKKEDVIANDVKERKGGEEEDEREKGDDEEE